MSAQPVPATGARWSGPDLRRQRLANYTVEDVLTLPDDAPRVELRDGVMRRRDRLEKPAGYAAAGIRHYWRIAQNPLHIHAYELVGGRYELVADSAEELVLAKPFEIRLPVRDIAP